MLTLVIIALLFRAAVGQELESRIVNGYDISIEEAPYQVFLTSVGYKCGGSIITPVYILTAAHCLTGMNEVEIRAGSANLQEGGQVFKSAVIYEHPLYDYPDFDVGLIKLQRPISLDNTTTKVVELADSGSMVPADQELIVSGWGATHENGPLSPQLKATVVKTYNNDECQNILSYNRYLTDRMLCAGFVEGGKDSCVGDSGGPAVLTSTGQQVGIVSHGIGCGRPGELGIYSNVTTPEIREWIREIAKV